MIFFQGLLDSRNDEEDTPPIPVPEHTRGRFYSLQVQELLKDLFNGKEPSRGINPDEAVAYGAAIQGDIIGGGSLEGEIVVLDVIALSQVCRDATSLLIAVHHYIELSVDGDTAFGETRGGVRMRQKHEFGVTLKL